MAINLMSSHAPLATGLPLCYASCKYVYIFRTSLALPSAPQPGTGLRETSGPLLFLDPGTPEKIARPLPLWRLYPIRYLQMSMPILVSFLSLVLFGSMTVSLFHLRWWRFLFFCFSFFKIFIWL